MQERKVIVRKRKMLTDRRYSHTISYGIYLSMLFLLFQWISYVGITFVVKFTFAIKKRCFFFFLSDENLKKTDVVRLLSYIDDVCCIKNRTRVQIDGYIVVDG